MANHGPMNGVKINSSFLLLLHPPSFNQSHPNSIGIDDPHKLIKVVASDGKSGDQKEVSYTNCKVIGNGSFGIVFQARLVGGSKDGEDIAIKKVLQDKRFKVRSVMTSPSVNASFTCIPSSPSLRPHHPRYL